MILCRVREAERNAPESRERCTWCVSLRSTHPTVFAANRQFTCSTGSRGRYRTLSGANRTQTQCRLGSDDDEVLTTNFPAADRSGRNPVSGRSRRTRRGTIRNHPRRSSYRTKARFCGEACVAMALQKLGKPADQDFVFDQSGLSPIDGRGCYTKDLADAIRNIGFDAGKVWYKVRSASAQADLDRHFQIILADLANGHTTVVYMHYDEQPKTTEHFRLIVGYDADRDEIIYQEPATSDGEYQRMSRQMLMKLWPLKYKAEEWTVVMMRLRPTSKLRGLHRPNSPMPIMLNTFTS